MKCAANIILGYLAAASVAAAAIVPRDYAAFERILHDVKDKTDALDAALRGFASDPAPIDAAANALIGAMDRGRAEMHGLPRLSLVETLRLLGPVDELESSTEALVADLEALRPAVVAAKACPLIRAKVDGVDKAGHAVIDEIVGKTDIIGRPVAEIRASKFRHQMDRGNEAFSEANCP